MITTVPTKIHKRKKVKRVLHEPTKVYTDVDTYQKELLDEIRILEASVEESSDSKSIETEPANVD